jgi:hypothetical protein
LSEVRRVLKPRGYLSFADFRAESLVDQLRDEFLNSGMEIVAEQQITREVLAALDLDNSRKLELINRLVPRVLRKPAREFASVVGSASYRSLADGRRQYLNFLLKNG